MKKMLKDFAEENNNKRARVASDDTAQTASQQKELEAQIVSLREQLGALKEGGAWEV